MLELSRGYKSFDVESFGDMLFDDRKLVWNTFVLQVR